MLTDKKVDLVLSGHEHIYQRTHQLGTGTDCPDLVPQAFSAGCFSGSDASMVQGGGTVFATAGLGGREPRDVDANDREARYFAAFSVKNRNPALGTLDVTVTADRLAARFVPAEGVRLQGFLHYRAALSDPSRGNVRDIVKRGQWPGGGGGTWSSLPMFWMPTGSPSLALVHLLISQVMSHSTTPIAISPPAIWYWMMLRPTHGPARNAQSRAATIGNWPGEVKNTLP